MLFLGRITMQKGPEYFVRAAKKVLAVASTIPQMTVLGIAGPGDPLANPEKTFKTFELISKTAPDIKLCLSTNGLALPDHVDTIAAFTFAFWLLFAVAVTRIA